MADNQTSILYDHYTDTCSGIGEAIKRRDRLMLYVILAVGIFALQAIFPSTSSEAVNQFIAFKFGLTLKLNLQLIGNVVWFLLLILTIRYFQVALFIERQHEYVHEVEEKLNRHTGVGTVTREGEAYLRKYPVFSNWTWFLYTILFPSMLLTISAIKIINEWKTVGLHFFYGVSLNTVAFILLAISIVLYLIAIHCGKKKENKI